MADEHLPAAAAGDGWADLDPREADGLAAAGDPADPRLQDRLGGLASSMVPDDPTDRALDALAARRRGRRTQQRLRLLVPAAAAVIVVLLAVVLWPGDRGADVSVVSDGTMPRPSTSADTGDGSVGGTSMSVAVAGTTAPPDTRPSPTVRPTASVPPTTTPSTTASPGPNIPVTTEPPSGNPTAPLVAEVRPHTGEVRVGERLLLDLVVRNAGRAPATYDSGNSSCPNLGQTLAGLTDDPLGVIDYAGNPVLGRGASIADLVASGNQVTDVWYGGPVEQLDRLAEGVPVICNADLRLREIGPGETVTETVGIDVIVAPGPLARDRVTIDFTFGYRLPSSTGAVPSSGELVAEATATVALIDDPSRDARLPEIYQALDADPRVRAVLDAPGDQQYLVRAGYHRGRWVIDLLPFTLAPGSGGQKVRVVVDPMTAQIVSFAPLTD